MASNLSQTDPTIAVVATHPAAPNSGDPCRVGVAVGVAIDDEGAGGAAATETTIDFGRKIWELSVDDNEASAIAAGDKLYYHDTGTGTPTTSINNTATAADAEAGIALGAVATNATTTIPVLITATT